MGDPEESMFDVFSTPTDDPCRDGVRLSQYNNDSTSVHYYVVYTPLPDVLYAFPVNVSMDSRCRCDRRWLLSINNASGGGRPRRRRPPYRLQQRQGQLCLVRVRVQMLLGIQAWVWITVQALVELHGEVQRRGTGTVRVAHGLSR